MKYLGMTLLIGIISTSAWAQTIPHHPRVQELEKMLQGEIQTSIRDLIPGQSFHAKVSIEALHRQTAKQPEKQSLPYFESEDEIKDEWDSPNKTDFELLARVTRISVKASVPATLTKDQLADVKQAIMSRIPYVEGRDLIEVDQRDWPEPTTHNKYTAWILGIGVALMSILGVMYFIVSYLSLGRVTKAIKHIKISPGESTTSSPVPSFSQPPPTTSGQLQFNDTLRMTEVIFTLIKGLESSAAFPELEHMLLLDQYLESHPGSAGALLCEFPVHLKNKLLAYSFSESWLKGLTNAGDMDGISFEIANKLTRIQRGQLSSTWNELLILCWRLNSRLPVFLKKLDASDSLLILRSLPQSIAIKAARELLPGEWAAVLKQTAITEVMMEEKIERYTKLALEESPLRSTGALEQYKKDVDLVKYLQTSDPEFEKEVYGAGGSDSSLEVLRPPFFPVLELDAKTMKEFSMEISIEEWSVALMNIPKRARHNLDLTFSDKQKMRLSELLKRNDRASLSADQIGLAREKIARQYKSFMFSKKTTQDDEALETSQEAA
jgi:hypothetical protein